MAEETKNPSRNVPNAMTGSMILVRLPANHWDRADLIDIRACIYCKLQSICRDAELIIRPSFCFFYRSVQKMEPIYQITISPLYVLSNTIGLSDTQGFVLSRAISPKGAVAIIVLLIFVLLLQVLAQLQASSRFLFALARDNALPFSASIRKTNANRVPVIAHWMAIFICMPFAFLLIGGLRTLRGVLAVTCSSLAYTGYVSSWNVV